VRTYNATLKEAIETEWREMQPDVERLFAAIDELDRVREMLQLYENRPLSGGEADQQVLSVLRSRDAALEQKVENLTPAFSYSDALRRLLTFYRWEQDGGDSEYKARRRQSQRLQAQEYVRLLRRRREREQAAQSEQEEPLSGAPRHGVLGAKAEAARQQRNSVAHPFSASWAARDKAMTLLPAPTAELLPTIGEALAKAAREYLESHDLEEVRFGALYRSYLAELFPGLFKDSPSESARLEAFRYHLIRAADKYGLRYEAGRVKLGSTAESTAGTSEGKGGSS
jgi:hypothetical protein